jgi:hypothetical protein
MPVWWKWDTRYAQTVVPEGLWVQIPRLVPIGVVVVKMRFGLVGNDKHFGKSTIPNLSLNGAVWMALRGWMAGDFDAKSVYDGNKLVLSDAEDIKRYAQKNGINTSTRWPDKPEAYIKNGVGVINYPAR